MTAQLQKRLAALEGLRLNAGPEQQPQLVAAMQAIIETVSGRHEWAPLKVPPFDWVEQPSEMDLLAERIKAQTLTGDDLALMESWPKCHKTPEDLVVLMAATSCKF